jgi:hypothetical protein
MNPLRSLANVVAALLRGPDPEPPQWRDTSLDDWRKRRDAEVEAERQARLANSPGVAGAPETATGSEHTETQRQQRIGG